MTKKDAIIILSSRLTPDRKLNAESELRVEKGVELFEKGVSSCIIMSGGPGLFTEETAEGICVPRGTHPVQSEAMRDYALSLGVPNDKILIQDYSSDTVGEAYFVKEMLLSPMRLRSVFIVTSNYHIKRAMKIYYQILGPDYSIEFLGVRTELDSDPNTLEREKKSLNTFLEHFGGLKPGDSAEIEQVLYNQHPLYKKIPDERKLKFYSSRETPYYCK